MEDFLPFLVASAALTGSPGPTNLALAATGSAFGPRRSLGLMAGCLAGMLCIMTLVGTGVTGLLFALPGVAPGLSIVASAYILYLAWRIGTAPPPQSAQQARPPSVPTGLVLTLANPKAYVAMTAMFSGFVLVAGNPLADGLAKAGVLLVVIVPVQAAWLNLGAGLSRLRGSPRWHKALNLGFATALVLSVVLALLL